MKFCNQCGSKVLDGQKVCTQCGTGLIQRKKPEPDPTYQAVSNVSQPEIKEKEKTSEAEIQKEPEAVPIRTKTHLSNKKKAGIGAAAAVLLLLAGSYQVMASQFSPEKTVEDLFDAVSEGDEERVADYVIRADGEKLDSDQLTWVMDMLQDPFLYGDIKHNMTQTALHYQKNGASADTDQVFFAGIPLALEQTGKRLGLFDRYSAVLHPLDLEVGLDHGDAIWTLNGETVNAQEVNTGIHNLGLHYPGTYELSVEVDMVFGRHEVERTVVHDGQWIEIPLHTDSLNIISHIAGADLYVNEEKTDITLEHGLTSFDRVLYDDGITFYAVADTLFGEITSKDVSPGESEIELQFLIGEELAGELLDQKFAALDEGRYLDEYSDVSGVNQVPTAVSIMADQAYLFEGKHDRFWQITVPYRETWRAHEDAGGEESYRDYDLVLMMPGNEGEWQVQELTMTNEERSGDWLSRNYDEEAQFAYLEERQPEDSKAAYRANEMSHVNDLINGFHTDNVSAINGGDKSRAVRMIHADAGAYRKTVTDYIDYLRGRDITQEFKGSDVIDVKEDGAEDVYVVTTEDLYIIHNNEENRSREAKFLTKYKVMLTDEGYSILELMSTDQLWSESL